MSNDQKSQHQNECDAKDERHSLLHVTCKCEESTADEDELYLCKHKDCNTEFYCDDCGPYYHHTISKKKRKNHPFQLTSQNIVSLNDLLEKKEDKVCFKMARKQLIALIGAKRYNQIKGYVETPMALASSNVPMVVELCNELTSFFASAQKAVIAHQAAQSATQNAVKLAETYNKIEPMEFNWYTYLWNPSAQKEQALQKLVDAQNLQLQKAKEANDALTGTVSTQRAIKVGAIGMAIATTIEMSIHAYRWHKGEINGIEWCRLLGKSVLRNTASMVGTAVGAKFGAVCGCKVGIWVGNVVAPGVGTVVGGAVGILGGIIFGYLMGKGTETVYEQYFPENKTEEEHKEKLLQEALLYFNFQPKDIKNAKIFNEAKLKKLFKQKALNAHPDRRDGDDSEWHRLSTYYGFLKALVEQNDSDKEIIKKRMEKMQALTF